MEQLFSGGTGEERFYWNADMIEEVEAMAEPIYLVNIDTGDDNEYLGGELI